MRGGHSVADLPEHQQAISQWPPAQVQVFQITGLTKFRDQEELAIAAVILD
jgi:hypothetical protein